MILPSKHLEINQSLFGVGSKILEQLDYPLSITILWKKVVESTDVVSFERFTLALDFLYAIKAIDLQDNLLKRNIYDSRNLG